MEPLEAILSQLASGVETAFAGMEEGQRALLQAMRVPWVGTEPHQ